jgi:hypothetical protein
MASGLVCRLVVNNFNFNLNFNTLQDHGGRLQQPLGLFDAPLHIGLLGTDNLGAKTLELLTAAWAKSTSDTYNIAIKPYFESCEEQGLPPLAATAATMARYIPWIVERGTIKATSSQPYFLAMNGFIRDHGAEPIEQGDFVVGKMRRGLAASHASLHPSRIRMYLPCRILVSSLHLAKDMCTQLTDIWPQA